MWNRLYIQCLVNAKYGLYAGCHSQISYEAIGCRIIEKCVKLLQICFAMCVCMSECDFIYDLEWDSLSGAMLKFVERPWENRKCLSLPGLIDNKTPSYMDLSQLSECLI